MNKSLILFTADYPYGTGETFLETEILYMSRGFDEVKIISQNISSNICRNLPENCSVERVNLELSPADKIKALFGVLNPIFWKEWRIIKTVYNQKFSKGILSTMLISLWQAKKVKDFIAQICKEQTSDTQTYFYSYWCDDVAFGLAMAQKEFPSIKTFCRIHRWDVYFEESAVNYLPFRHFITENLSKIFSISQDGIEYALQNWKVTQKEKFILSRLGVKNTDAFQISNNDPFLIVSCSNLIPVKRVQLIAEALQGITDVTIKWVHIGDGIGRNDLEKRISLLPENIKVDLKGKIPNPEIYSCYAVNRPDLFINVSSSEGVPVSIMEAMSFGIPVIATNVGGTSEIVNNQNGQMLTKEPTAKDVALAIQNIITLSSNEYMAKRKTAYSTWKEEYNAEKNYSVFIETILTL